MQDHSYHRPTSLEEALDCRSAVRDAVVLAGGTDLVVQRRGRLSETPILSLRAVPGLDGIEATADELRIGALAKLQDIAEHEHVRQHFPSLRAGMLVMGSRQIRNVATIGGNLCNASPGADAAPPLITLAARVELTSRSGTRLVLLDDFFVGPGMTDMRPDEIMTAVLINTPSPTWRFSFQRRGRIKMDIAIASLALAAHIENGHLKDVRICGGAVAPVPLRMTETEKALRDQPVASLPVDTAREVARNEVKPIDDIRSGADYRRTLIGVFLKRAIAEVTTS